MATQPHSQDLSSYHLLEWARRDPDTCWSHATLTNKNIREGFSVISQLVALSFVALRKFKKERRNRLHKYSTSDHGGHLWPSSNFKGPVVAQGGEWCKFALWQKHCTNYMCMYKVVKSSQLLTQITVYFMICASFSPEQSFCSDASEKMARLPRAPVLWTSKWTPCRENP